MKNLRILIITLLIINFLDLTLSGKDQYGLLGVGRNANTKQIKKAFRKKAMIYHPDKNQGEKHEWAKEKFSELSNAYDILSDEKKRQLYDQGGEDAVKHAEGGGGGGGGFGGGNFDDIFNSFFGGGGGGRRRKRSGGRKEQNNESFFSFGDDDMGGFGGMGGGRGRKQKKNISKMFEESDLTEMNTLNGEFQTKKIHVWAVLFWNPSDDMEELTKEFIDFNSKMKMILRTAHVNCQTVDSKELCDKYSQHLNKTPQVQLFPTDKDEPQVVRMPTDMKQLVYLSTKLIKNHVDTVNSTYYKNFINRANEKRLHTFQLFTERATTSPVLMALANDFKEYALFAEVRDDKTLERKFGITKPPAFVYVEDASEYKGITYDGQFKKDLMSIWIQKYALQTKKSSSSEEINHLNPSRIDMGNCSKTDSNFCLILFYEYSTGTHVKNLAKKLSEKYNEDPVNVYILDKNQVCGSCVLDDEFKNGDVFLLRTKRSKFSRIGFSEKDDYDLMTSSIDSYLGGSMMTLKMKGTASEFFK